MEELLICDHAMVRSLSQKDDLTQSRQCIADLPPDRDEFGTDQQDERSAVSQDLLKLTS